MGDGFEAAASGNPGFQLRAETVRDFNHLSALCADQVMVMAVVALGQQFEAGHAVPQVEALDKREALQQVHGAIDGG